MFSENHHKILKELAVGFSNTETLAIKAGLTISFTKYLLEELKQHSFIEALYDRNSNGDNEIVYASLGNSGQAAIEAPEYFLGQSMDDQAQKINNFNGPMSGVIGSDNAIVTQTRFSQINNSHSLTQAAQDIKALLDQLTIDYPNDDTYTQAGRAIGTIKNNPTLKQRLGNAIKESGTTAVEKAIEAITGNPAVGVIIAGVKGFIDA